MLRAFELKMILPFKRFALPDLEVSRRILPAERKMMSPLPAPYPVERSMAPFTDRNSSDEVPAPPAELPERISIWVFFDEVFSPSVPDADRLMNPEDLLCVEISMPPPLVVRSIPPEVM